MKNIKETEEYVVVEFTNDSEKSYEVGYPKAAGYTRENIEEAIADASKKHDANAFDITPGYQDVFWKVDGDSETSREAINIGIIGGYVSKDNGLIYKYRLHFADTGLKLGHTFTDESSDKYVCTTPRPGNHYIDYNSDKPSIIGVR